MEEYPNSKSEAEFTPKVYQDIYSMSEELLGSGWGKLWEQLSNDLLGEDSDGLVGSGYRFGLGLMSYILAEDKGLSVEQIIMDCGSLRAELGLSGGKDMDLSFSEVLNSMDLSSRFPYIARAIKDAFEAQTGVSILGTKEENLLSYLQGVDLAFCLLKVLIDLQDKQKTIQARSVDRLSKDKPYLGETSGTSGLPPEDSGISHDLSRCALGFNLEPSSIETIWEIGHGIYASGWFEVWKSYYESCCEIESPELEELSITHGFTLGVATMALLLNAEELSTERTKSNEYPGFGWLLNPEKIKEVSELVNREDFILNSYQVTLSQLSLTKYTDLAKWVLGTQAKLEVESSLGALETGFDLGVNFLGLYIEELRGGLCQELGQGLVHGSEFEVIDLGGRILEVIDQGKGKINSEYHWDNVAIEFDNSIPDIIDRRQLGAMLEHLVHLISEIEPKKSKFVIFCLLDIDSTPGLRILLNITGKRLEINVTCSDESDPGLFRGLERVIVDLTREPKLLMELYDHHYDSSDSNLLANDYLTRPDEIRLSESTIALFGKYRFLGEILERESKFLKMLGRLDLPIDSKDIKQYIEGFKVGYLGAMEIFCFLRKHHALSPALEKLALEKSADLRLHSEAHLSSHYFGRSEVGLEHLDIDQVNMEKLSVILSYDYMEISRLVDSDPVLSRYIYDLIRLHQETYKDNPSRVDGFDRGIRLALTIMYVVTDPTH
ncbi:hypothetical protein H6792_00610 [Candidatus Nomurabacteria bacterium]|nr:hypothetical protein [Candidatus Nomurabacteria bacterium]